ncbi:hypothetical protein TSH100_27165 [Azospirillum sp. TSH100]|uniref:hypothetical protein n=1 Tax=Azospirillum sp. TSH100 TaxID=652764 RepID=UPI000D61C581|nr:hypothetical protein [Azospirillum sp. TSH100]PWC81365.1 hypothetical protein TSH100_27165 [Azospirillum sp. TSH100]QCG91966.1 hypothetical protein E6C72_29770 [Azospirillum sp. TSH100]
MRLLLCNTGKGSMSVMGFSVHAASFALQSQLRNAAVSLSIASVLAFPGIAPAAEPTDPAKQGTEASLERSAMRALTYKVGTFLTNTVAYSVTTGDMMQGLALSSVLTAYSSVSYVLTDYFWDSAYPQMHAGDAPAEVLKESAERTTWKFMTYKVVNLPALMAVSYYATGTASGALGLASGLSLAKAGWFYANTMLWDYYSPPPSKPEQPKPMRPAPTLPMADAARLHAAK